MVPSLKFENSNRLLTVKDTEMVCAGVFDPDALTVIVPVYVPEASPAELIDTVSEPGVAPELGETRSHAALDVAVQLRVPVPSLYAVTV